MANIITGIRIVCSIALLFCSPLSLVFFVIYSIAGFTDMIDGTIARITNTESEFGSKLDTAADFIFFAVCMIKLVPVLKIPFWVYIWICIIASIKILDFVLTYIKEKRFVPKHTILNKVTGGLLFLMPFSLKIINLKYSAVIVCIFASAAAIMQIICKPSHKKTHKFHKYIEK